MGTRPPLSPRKPIPHLNPLTIKPKPTVQPVIPHLNPPRIKPKPTVQPVYPPCPAGDDMAQGWGMPKHYDEPGQPDCELLAACLEGEKRAEMPAHLEYGNCDLCHCEPETVDM